jgi:hypothetical protein
LISCCPRERWIPSKIYKHNFQHMPAFSSSVLWKSECMSKHNFLAW